MAEPLRIRFEGAARTVTGSRHRIELGRRSWLLDCGLFQGHRDEAEAINRTFRFDPARLDAVVLSHAHLDHSGNLPALAARGYAGRIHATTATADLCRVMLPDAAFVMERDVEFVNRRGRQPPRRALYTPEDARDALALLAEHPYGAPWDLLPGVSARFLDAGHILGSAITLFDFESGGRRLRLAMSGDLGRPRRHVLRDPEVPAGVDVLVLESTYGDRIHAPAAETERRLADVVRRTAERGGRLLVPAFAVGRTQELVATLHALWERGELPEVPIFVDSPLAREATEVFVRHPECFDSATSEAFRARRGAPFGFARLRYVATPEESRALNDRSGAMIVISASGMCEGGRILHHLRHGLGDERNTVLLVGFQAEGTLGRRLEERAESVNVFGEPVRRRAEVVALDGFSAHADQGEILDWVARMDPPPRRIFLVHGEIGPAETLAALLRGRTGAEVRIPRPGEGFDLRG